MRYTSIDQRRELILGFDLNVEDVVRDVYYLNKFHCFSIVVVSSHF
jgi:hypothetical protein